MMDKFIKSMAFFVALCSIISGLAMMVAVAPFMLGMALLVALGGAIVMFISYVIEWLTV